MIQDRAKIPRIGLRRNAAPQRVDFVEKKLRCEVICNESNDLPMCPRVDTRGPPSPLKPRNSYSAARVTAACPASISAARFSTSSTMWSIMRALSILWSCLPAR